MKHKRDFKALEKRRLKGAKLLERGLSKSEVARQLGVCRDRQWRRGSSAWTRAEPIAQAWHAGTTAPTGRRAGARVGPTSDARSGERGVFDGAVDTAAHRQADHTALWGAI